MILIYIDPGAGTMVIQALIAAALAIPFFFRTHASRFIRHIRRQVSDEYEDGSSD
jgi:hypothetical protein